MATKRARKQTVWSFLGSSYATDADYLSLRLRDLNQALTDVSVAVSAAYAALEAQRRSGSASGSWWTRGAKDALSPAFNDLQRAVETSATSHAASSLPRLPTYGHGALAHELYRQHERTLEHAVVVKSALSRALFGRDLEAVRAGLDDVSLRLAEPTGRGTS